MLNTLRERFLYAKMNHVTSRRFHCKGDHLYLKHMFLEHMFLEHMVLEHMVLGHMFLEHMVLEHMVLEHMVLGHTIETYGRRPHNRNIWPYTIARRRRPHAWPILLFALQ